jgi:hypothetical protein
MSFHEVLGKYGYGTCHGPELTATQYVRNEDPIKALVAQVRDLINEVGEDLAAEIVVAAARRAERER